MDQIQVSEISSPEALVMKKIVKNIGLNIRPEKAIFNSATNNWTVSLRAVVPSQVMVKGKPFKTFLYRFDKLGEAEVRSIDNELKIISFPKGNDVDLELYLKWTELTQKLIKEILRVGEPVWGHLTYVQMLLRPMYSLILHTLTHKKLLIHEMNDQQQQKHIQFLRSRGYLEVDSSHGTYVASNMLTNLEELLYKKYAEKGTDFFVTSQVVGMIFAKHYKDIKSELHAHAPSVYVDTSTAYYVDAIRAKQPILMSENDLWKKYRMIGHRPTTKDPTISYPTVISEIVAGKLLDRNEEGYVRANDDVLRKLEPLGVELSKHITDI